MITPDCWRRPFGWQKQRSRSPCENHWETFYSRLAGGQLATENHGTGGRWSVKTLQNSYRSLQKTVNISFPISLTHHWCLHPWSNIKVLGTSGHPRAKIEHYQYSELEWPSNHAIEIDSLLYRECSHIEPHPHKYNNNKSGIFERQKALFLKFINWVGYELDFAFENTQRAPWAVLPT